MWQTVVLATFILVFVCAVCVALVWKHSSPLPEKLAPTPFPIDVWGPRFWFVLHTVTQSYPEKPTPQDKENAYNFITAFGKVLPCPSCREHFARIGAEDRVADALGTRDEFMEWGWRIHNRVNVDGGKPAVSRADAMRYFMSLQRG